jgi:predicted transcriptional regulator YdeE
MKLIALALLVLLQTSGAKMEPRVQKIDGFDVIGTSVRTRNSDEMGPNGKIPALWQRTFKERLPDQIPAKADHKLLALYSDYASDQNGDYTYTIGMRVTSTANVPEGMKAIHVPAGNYAMLTTEKGVVSQVVPQAWQKVWTLSKEQLGGERTFKVDYESYDDRAMDPNNSQVDLYIGVK